ncbi:6-phosphogluconolactonase [Pelodictyon luteolum]|uniref:6-phosphogluconolactonase n=1 Tax=Chlorobium luteolum (strain DSM 273 / BCRC 81028 / 2530) TaxID=319225 RepID=Q3B635_CHLL3|nr:6-phosphogluconolactonase [Pelodictyon luteolum]ABB23196.1 6-phosphogluconolactonase [Pelodictyon luteolum DSM 273]
MDKSTEIFTGTPEELAEHAAAIIILEAWRSVSGQGFFAMALSGGNSPRALYRLLRTGLHASRFLRHDLEPPKDGVQGDGTIGMPWNECLFFWGDERSLPPGDPRSNYRMAEESLFHGMEAGGLRVYRMEGEKVPDTAAAAYESLIRQSPAGSGGALREGFPMFDLVLLGLGPDGHTASLFPGNTGALEEKSRWVIAVQAPDLEPRVPRLTFTLPVLNHARTVLFFVPSVERASLATSIISGQRPELPASRVRPVQGRTLWFKAQP